ncbi:MAG TPA: AAA family ATPase [Saprospiraceae bacterium]|nr:AAA family ATPase [Saprospiraceae bacterium]
MALQKYPVGLQDFGEIRKNGYVYVDKTHHIHNLLNSAKYYFLSRPRRFGKSLLISTLECVFKGKKELFDGLYISDKWTFDEYPVIRISFSNIGYRTKGLQKALSDELMQISEQYEITLRSDKEDIANCFDELIKSLHKKYNQQVVVLIDEYDKPIIDYLDKENIHKAHENRGVMKTFYSILKDADPYLKLVFITGVSKFTQVSIFSDLNNLNDLTLKRDYNEICGITQTELDTYFQKELEIYDKEKLRLWYNGYRWHVDGSKMYNPFSILNFFSSGDYFNYWYTTGTPTFLIEKSKKEQFYEMDEVRISSFKLQSFDIDALDTIPILFQTGYLTIVGKDEILDDFILSYPNKEVKQAYLERLTDHYIGAINYSSKNILDHLLKALRTKDEAKLTKAINDAFAHIPYPLWQKENEHFYHAIIHLLFSLLGVYIHSEVHTKDGRADAIILFEDHAYCLEFKLDKTAEIALQQAKDKKYLEAYRNKVSHLYIIAINFESKNKKVEGLIWEEI